MYEIKKKLRKIQKERVAVAQLLTGKKIQVAEGTIRKSIKIITRIEQIT